MNKKVFFYSLSTCPACKKAKEYLDIKSVKYEYIEVDKLPDSEQWIMTKEIKRYNPDLTFPTIVVSKTIIGFDELGLSEALK
ncbi:MAG: glutaredoxin family protein [Thermodesulfovibrionales bacterium]|nr:glutaredoxin family protein [Thermodesulfovibrionales bacterium]